ncbi:hypothetical protein M513_13826 [Trichuris suis]|uniref:Uncharacterized protein n=1 Tax=Trichuris suis TaxID=68888 RepID=A0A085LK01_9BILA|nr:hypothetical protein M513_13826 [Trichuris suis]
MEIMIVDCQFAVEIIQCGPGKLLAALCYQNTITGSGSTKGEIPPSVLCRRWRYPGTKLPQLQLPGYLKSPHSSVLFYTTASLELSGGNNSKSQNTTQWPVNNYERTGFGGKGTLPQFGPNPALYLLVTRRSNGTTEVFIEETDQRTALPWLWVNTSATVEGPTEQKEPKLTTYCNMSEIYTMLQNGTLYHKGYLKNKHNTDNAWLEGTIIHLHDDAGGCFSQFPVNTEVQSRRYRWLVMPNSTTPVNFALSFGISSGVHLGNGTHAYS